jgi:hypothetical protein
LDAQETQVEIYRFTQAKMMSRITELENRLSAAQETLKVSRQLGRVDAV